MHLRIEFDSGVGPTCNCFNGVSRPFQVLRFLQGNINDVFIFQGC